MSDSLWPTGLQHTRIPCSSLLLRVYSDSCPLRQWCYLTTSSSAALFSFCLQSFSASGSFPMSLLFASGGQNIGASASAILPMNIQGWFPLRLTGLISLQSKRLSRVFPSTAIRRHQFFRVQPSSWSNMTTGKILTSIIWTFASQEMSLLCNMLPRLTIAFLPRRKRF